VAFHALGFALVYFGVGRAAFDHGTHWVFSPAPRAGATLILLAAALAAWALLVFRSWRLEARIEDGHELCTRGPFGLVRHPIYLATDLLFVGTALWVPSATVLAGSALAFFGADLRARAEERILLDAFGDAYRGYAARVPRFVPGLY
jgi:protein-S-isoprenylcysteine O-methyltransferase Ste14